MKIYFALLVCCSITLATSCAGEGSPQEQIQSIQKQLNSDESETTFKAFFAGSYLEKQKPELIKTIDDAAQKAIGIYGKPTAMDMIDEQPMGNSLMKLRWITKHDNELPLFWSVLFYKRQEKWEPISINFNDNPDKIDL